MGRAFELRAAIRGHCQKCCFRPGKPGTPLEQITLCRNVECHLWHVRPRARKLVAEKVIAETEMAFGPFPLKLVYDVASLRNKPGPDSGSDPTC